MNRRPLWLLPIALLALSGAALAEKKVTLCHLPPGDPASPQTISVGESAVRAHLAHGDQLGACAASCPSSCDDGDLCTSDSCGADGRCLQSPVNCDDGNVCTGEACDPSVGCLQLPNDGLSCSDGNDCTDADACAGTECRGTAIAGCCALDRDCDDLDSCTDDSCFSGSCRNALRKLRGREQMPGRLLQRQRRRRLRNDGGQLRRLERLHRRCLRPDLRLHPLRHRHPTGTLRSLLHRHRRQRLRRRSRRCGFRLLPLRRRRAAAGRAMR